MNNRVTNAVPARPLGTFNFLPWREWHQAQRRRRQRLLWIGGCILAQLPGWWLQARHYTENQSQLFAYQQQQASNYGLAAQLEELARRQNTIEDWLEAATVDRQTAHRWSALATLLRAGHRTSGAIVQELGMSDGQLVLYGQSTEVSDLESLESQGDRIFGGEYAFREVRRQHGVFHFQMDVPWAGDGMMSSAASGLFP